MKEITKGAPIQDRKELDKFIISEIPFGCTAKQLSHNVIDNKASIGDYSKMYAVILNNKKYILTEQYESCEAYDLINDPMEEHNIMTEVSREEMEHLGLTLKQYKNSKLKQRIRLRVKDN